jgi:hypothetical protein
MSNNATGPRTDAGKARSSQNALKHGLCSQRAVIPGEDPAEWDTFREEIVRGNAPCTFLERELAERVALHMWRQRRVALYEADLVSAAYGEEAAEGSESDDPKPTPSERARLLKEALDRIIRYQSNVGRQLKEALKMLRECQAQRQAALPCRPEAPLQRPSASPAPDPQSAEFGSSFSQMDAAEQGLRRARAVLPRPGVSFADFDIVPKTPATKT